MGGLSEGGRCAGDVVPKSISDAWVLVYLVASAAGERGKACPAEGLLGLIHVKAYFAWKPIVHHPPGHR